MRRAAWIGAAVVSAGVIVSLASHGHRPDPGLVRFEAAGIMLAIPPETVGEVVVSAGARRWRFERAGAGGWVASPASPGGARVAAHLDRGLRFLHVSAPQRVLAPAEIGAIAPSEFGLDPARYSVAVRSAGSAPFTVEFGARNPQGLAQYARVAGRREILLLPGFVGEEWEAVIGAR